MRGVAAFLVALSLLPTARAEPSCSAVTEQPPNALGVYLVLNPFAPDAEVWLESNGYPGLQRQPCSKDPGDDPTPADTHVIDLA